MDAGVPADAAALAAEADGAAAGAEADEAADIRDTGGRTGRTVRKILLA